MTLDRTCAIDGCSKTPRSQTADWCPMHYHRWYRHGDPTVTLLTGKPWKGTHGYLVGRRRGHPIADKNGDVFIHRMVLFDKIGYGPHWCHWCGRHVQWRASLDADHVDANRLNNDPANLVPSCRWCNRSRSAHARWLSRGPDEWETPVQ